MKIKFTHKAGYESWENKKRGLYVCVKELDRLFNIPEQCNTIWIKASDNIDTDENFDYIVDDEYDYIACLHERKYSQGKPINEFEADISTAIIIISHYHDEINLIDINPEVYRYILEKFGPHEFVFSLDYEDVEDENEISNEC